MKFLTSCNNFAGRILKTRTLSINKKNHSLIKKFFSAASIISLCIPLGAQEISVSGIIKDSTTQEAIMYAVIGFANSDNGMLVDLNGRFTLKNTMGLKTLRVSCVGYTEQLIELANEQTHDMVIFLQPSATMLSMVTVGKKNIVKYSRKDNLAVEFMKKVIENKNSNRLEFKPYYQVERYEKLTTSLDNFNDAGKIFTKFPFLKNGIDTSEITGRPILNLSIKETFTDVYFQKMPKIKREILKAKRVEGVGKDLDENINQNVQELFKGINLYDNSIKLLLYDFVSPLSSTLAITFYKFFISDTVQVDEVECVQITFVPANPQSFGFFGDLYITLDGNYSLKKADLQVSPKVNLNFAQNLKISQTFIRLPDSTWVISEENLYVNLYLFKGLPDVLMHQYKSYRNYDFEETNHSEYHQPENKMAQDESVYKKTDEYWEANRPVPLNSKEAGMKKMFAQLRELSLYKSIVKVSGFVSSGYIITGGSKEKSYFDIGPLQSALSFNKIEGCHIKLGGMTTANLSKHLFVSGYAAYGTRDRKFKYNAKLTYSINKKKYHENEYPRNNLSFLYEYDIYALGANYHGAKDDLLVSWGVGAPITKMSYIRQMRLSYEKEWNKSFSSKIIIKNQTDHPTGTLVYMQNSAEPREIAKLTTTEIGIQFRYVVGGEAKDERAPLMSLSKYGTEFSLAHYIGIKKFLGGDYNYQHTELAVKTRVNLSAFGYLNTKVTAGKVWSKVPFPLLILPNANQSVLIQSDAFHKMNALEFIADQYIGLDLTYHLNGLIFNRIPYFNFLKLREVISFHGVWGSLSKKNNPLYSDGLFLLPEETNPLGKAPYMEMSVGIENIFKVLRVDYFHRLSYTEGVKRRGGVRFTFKLTF